MHVVDVSSRNAVLSRLVDGYDGTSLESKDSKLEHWRDPGIYVDEHCIVPGSNYRWRHCDTYGEFRNSIV